MAKQIQFSMHEAALLLDAYLKTLSGEMTRITAVKSCSQSLRQMAVNNGIEIDEIYRNTNGISFQISSMESAYQGKTIRKPATRLFNDIVQLYHSDRKKYETILKEAKLMAEGKQDNETLFMNWLSGQVSPGQLSELYMSYKEIEEECKKFKVVRDSLFEELNTFRLKKIRATIEQSKMFRFFHKKSMGKYASALRLLASYAEQREPVSITEPTEKAYPSVEEKTPPKETTSNNDPSSEVTAPESPDDTQEPIQQEETECITVGDTAVADENTQVYTIDFNNFRRFSNSKPVSVSYFDDPHPVSAWRELLIKVCELLIDDYPGIMERLREEGIAGKNSIGLRDEASSYTLRRTLKINDNYYIEGNQSASDIVRVIKSLLSECAVDFENVVIQYSMVAVPEKSVVQEPRPDKTSPNKSKSALSGRELHAAVVPYDMSGDHHAEMAAGSTPDESADEKLLDFADFGSLAYTKPISASFRGQEYATDNWKQLYLWLCRNIFPKYKKAFAEMRAVCMSGRGDIWLLNTQLAYILRKPREIGPDFFVETNRNSTDLIKNLGMILNWCGVKPSDIVVRYVITDSSRYAAAVQKISGKSQAESVTTGVGVPTDFDRDKFVAVLMRRYPTGMMFDSIDFENFRDTYFDMFTESLPFQDKGLEKRLRTCGVVYQERLFPADGLISPDVAAKLFAYIEKSFSSGKKVLYYNAIWADLADDLVFCYCLTDAKMLRLFIEFSAPAGKYYFHNGYMSVEKYVKVSHTAEVEECFLSAGQPLTYDEVSKVLSYLPLDIIKEEIRKSDKIIMDGQTRYFHRDIFEITDDELPSIRNMIAEAIADEGYAAWGRIYERISHEMPAFMENNPYLAPLGVRSALAPMLSNDFSFSGDVISAANAPLNRVCVYLVFAQNHDTFTYDDICRIMSDIDVRPDLMALGSVAVRVSHDLFISKRDFHVDVSATDDAIATYMPKDYIPFQDIDSFLLFPNAGYEWNEYLLESYLHFYSNRFMLIHKDVALDHVAGAVVKRDGKLTEFADICADMLANDNIELTKSKALDRLVELGMIKRRKYAEIETVIKEAQRIRNQKG